VAAFVLPWLVNTLQVLQFPGCIAGAAIEHSLLQDAAGEVWVGGIEGVSACWYVVDPQAACSLMGYAAGDPSASACVTVVAHSAALHAACHTVGAHV
jgi:hypothetical protein